MVHAPYIILLLSATIAFADYYVDNANTSVIYAMAPSQSGQSWQTFSVSTQSLDLKITNSTGNYTIPLDASHCYDQNYALGVCGTGDNCYVQIPFTGSGITMYVFSAGFSGMMASFAVDGGNAVSNSIDAPPPPAYQVSNVSLYSIQGLISGNHTMVMTMLDWGGVATSMKFDYAYINETLVVSPTTTTTPISTMTSVTTSQASSQTPSASETSTADSSVSNKTNTGAIVGGTVGGVIALASGVIGWVYFRKRRAQHRGISLSGSNLQINPFMSEYRNGPAPPRGTFFTHPESNLFAPPLARSAVLRDALVAGTQPSSLPIQRSRSIRSGISLSDSAPYRPPSSIGGSDTHQSLLSTSHVADVGLPFEDPQTTTEPRLTAEQFEVIGRLREEKVPMQAIARIIEGFVTPHPSAGSTGRVKRKRSGVNALPPPSYQTR